MMQNRDGDGEYAFRRRVLFGPGFEEIGQTFVHLAGKLFTEFGQAFAFPFAERQLTQFGKGNGFQCVMLGDQASSFRSALQVAGVDGAERLAFHRFRELTGLLYAVFGQGDIKVAVHADLVCIGSFAVAK